MVNINQKKYHVIKFIMVKLLFILAMVFPTACNFTEVPADHTNPLDTIYDSGNLRMVLSYPAKSNSGYKMYYSSIYYNNAGQEDSVFAVSGTPQLLYKAGTLLQADLDNVKNKAALTGFTVVKNLTATSDDYKGEYENSTIAAGVYVIQVPYKFTNKTTETTGIFHSNIVSYNP